MELISEKPFALVVRDFEHVESWPRYYGIIASYTILRAKTINLLGNDVFSMDLIEQKKYGTIVHLDTKENVQSALLLIPKGIRYFGYVNATEELVTNNFAYIGLPISLNYLPDMDTPEGMYDVYPRITLSSLKSNKELDVNMIGRGIEVKLCNVVTQTPNTMAYSALIKGEEYHVTRCVANGKSSLIAKKEMPGKGNYNLSLVAYSVLM